MKEQIYNSRIAWRGKLNRYCYECGGVVNGDTYQIEVDTDGKKIALFHKKCIEVSGQLNEEKIMKLRELYNN